MNIMPQNRVRHYRNAIEPLVVEEVQRQLQQLAPKLLQYINFAEIIAYALNRLPALYATSSEGWERLHLRAKTQLQAQIVLAVRQGLAAVQRDPLRVSTPLDIPEDMERMQSQIFAGMRATLGTEWGAPGSTISDFKHAQENLSEKLLSASESQLVEQLSKNA